MSDMTTVLVKGIIMTIILITDLGHRMADWLSTVTQVAMHVHAQPKFQLTMHTFLEKQISKHNMGNKASGILIFPFFTIALPLWLWNLRSMAAAAFLRGTLPVTRCLLNKRHAHICASVSWEDGPSGKLVYRFKS